MVEPELRVLSLPGLALVHTHRLEGMQVWGLAADPCGTALAVCDYASQSTHVLAWPLPGMPQLEWLKLPVLSLTQVPLPPTRSSPLL